MIVRIPSVICVVLVLAAASIASAQEAPSMSPASRQLAYFVGRWQVETTTEQAQGASAAAVAVQDVAWLEGTSFLVMRPEGGTLPENSARLAILGYDPRERVYTADFFISPDARLSMTGLVTGSRWTWLSRDGQFRQTIQVLSPSSYTFQFARSRGTVGWLTVSEGKAVKIGHDQADHQP